MALGVRSSFCVSGGCTLLHAYEILLRELIVPEFLFVQLGGRSHGQLLWYWSMRSSLIYTVPNITWMVLY